MRAGTVIVGTGQAGFQVAESLRMAGYQEPITLIGEEPHLPYQRPPLSKGFILDKQGMDEIELRPTSFYSNHEVELIVGERVEAIEANERRVRLASGAAKRYDALVLAVGARNRELAVDGAELDGVLYLRTLDQARAFKQRLQDARSVLVIGGGFVGLELAAAAESLGRNVTVLELQPRLMSRVVAPIISDFYEQLHTSHEASILCNSTVCEIVGHHGKVQAVRLSHGPSVPADLVLVGIGVVPNVELALGAGLAVRNGVTVDAYLQTTNPDVRAIGDCAEHPNVFTGRRVRLESVQNATDQARCVAHGIVGQRRIYDALPWFWTDQYDTRLQMAGLSHGFDQSVVRGNPETRRFSTFYFKKGRLIAVDSISCPLDHIFARKLLACHSPITPEQAADESVSLKLAVSRA